MLVVDTEARAPEAIPVTLPGGAVWVIRPATSFEVSLATTRAGRIAAGLVAGENAAVAAGEILGEELGQANFSDPDWLSALVERLALIELLVVCGARWEGIVDRSKQPLEMHRGAIAIVLRDPVISQRASSAVNSRVHQEIAEKNVSAVSPTGGAVMEDNTAPVAVHQDRPAPEV